MGVYCTDLADAMLEEITERKGAVFAFSAEKWIRMLRKPGRGLVFFPILMIRKHIKKYRGNHFIEKYV